MPDLVRVSLLAQALASPFGTVCLPLGDPKDELARLRSARSEAKAQFPELSGLTFMLMDNGHIWIVKAVSKDE